MIEEIIYKPDMYNNWNGNKVSNFMLNRQKQTYIKNLKECFLFYQSRHTWWMSDNMGRQRSLKIISIKYIQNWDYITTKI